MSGLPGLRALWRCLVLVPVFGGCDLFSFPAPVERAAPRQLGDACMPTLSRDESGCGVDEHGAAMACFRGSSLAGEDFCAPACSPDDEPEPYQVCTAEGALLPACDPSQREPEANCPAGFNCYRTSLFEPRGICVKMPVCSTNADCPDTTHGTCASELVRGLAGDKALFLPLDHLNCVTSSCFADQINCPTGEVCLGVEYDPHVADLCVPRCDAELHCPPNYSCAKLTSGGGGWMCLPGLPGLRCDGQHCVGGSCDDTGAGFSVCSRDCASTKDCQILNTKNDAFYCVDGGAGLHCVTPRPFHGANCENHAECRTDLNEFCSFYDLRGLNERPGECRQHCKDDETCDPRGGLPHTCFRGKEGGCFPGKQGLRCKLASECLEGLSCEEVPEQPELGLASARICTRPCKGQGTTPAAIEADADAVCAAPGQVNGGGYCASGFCRLQGEGGDSCSRGAQCSSGLCDIDTKTCLARAVFNALQ